MQSTSVQSAQELQEKLVAVAGLSNLTTSVLAHSDDGTSTIIGLSWLPSWKPAARLSVWTFAVRPPIQADVTSVWNLPSDGYACDDLAEAFAKVATVCKKSELLINSLSVKLTDAHSAAYLAVDDPLVQLCRAAWSEVLPCKSKYKPDEKLCAQFENELKGLDAARVSVWVKHGAYLKEMVIEWKQKDRDFLVNRHNSVKSPTSDFAFKAGDALCAFSTVAHSCQNSDILLDTLRAYRNETAAESQELRDLARAIVSGIIGGAEKPLDTETQELVHLRARDGKAFRARLQNSNARAHAEDAGPVLLSYLAGGKKGVDSWNEIADAHKTAIQFSNSLLSKHDLSGLRFEGLNFKDSNFEQAKMRKLAVKNADFSGASFAGADLCDSKLIAVNAAGANFSNAKLKKTKLQKSSLQNANFDNADVEGCDFKESDVRAVDFTKCNAAKAAGFSKAKYDETTKLPADFPHRKDMQWKGKGPDPHKLSTMAQKTTGNTVADFAGFVQLIKDKFDKSRVDKALSMLKKESFELFTQQDDTGVVGVIKSQTDPDLLYACNLKCEGTFACCTQNLNPCGGLRGALCKHLLVLVIGLTKAGTLDATKASEWVIGSKDQAPTLDKEALTEVFLRYQSARTGEIDWRPTETIPEDYYAF